MHYPISGYCLFDGRSLALEGAMASSSVPLTAEVRDLRATEATIVVRWGTPLSEDSSRQEAPAPVPAQGDVSAVRLLPPTGRVVLQRMQNGVYKICEEKKSKNAAAIGSFITSVQRSLFPPPYGQKGLWNEVAEGRLRNWLLTGREPAAALAIADTAAVREPPAVRPAESPKNDTDAGSGMESDTTSTSDSSDDTDVPDEKVTEARPGSPKPQAADADTGGAAGSGGAMAADALGSQDPDALLADLFASQHSDWTMRDWIARVIELEGDLSSTSLGLATEESENEELRRRLKNALTENETLRAKVAELESQPKRPRT